MIKEELSVEMNVVNEEDAYIDMDWLTVKNYEFRILIMVACYAQKKAAFRGTLKDMCDLLGVKSTVKANQKIREAIQSLEDKGEVKTILDNQCTWTVSLSVKAERKPKVVRIKKVYIKTIQNYKAGNKNDSVSCDNIFKVFIYLYSGDDEQIRTYAQIAKALDVSETIVRNAVKALTTIEFENDLVVKKKIAYVKCIETNEYFVVGTKYEIRYDWDKEEAK